MYLFLLRSFVGGFFMLKKNKGIENGSKTVKTLLQI